MKEIWVGIASVVVGLLPKAVNKLFCKHDWEVLSNGKDYVIIECRKCGRTKSYNGQQKAKGIRKVKRL